MARIIRVKLPPLHPGQMAVRDAVYSKRFVFANWGRRAGKCPTPDSIVLSQDEVVNVGDLSDGDTIIGVNEMFEPIPVEVSIIGRVKKPVVEITLSNGMVLKRSCDHPIMTIRGWKMSGLLGYGDMVLVSVPRLKAGDGNGVPSPGIYRISKLIDFLSSGIVPNFKNGRIIVRKDIIKVGPIAVLMVKNVRFLGKREVVELVTNPTHTFISPVIEHNTTGGTIIMLEWALRFRDQLIWWAAPTLSIAKISWRMFRRMIPRRLIRYDNKTDVMIELVTGSTIWWKSTERPQNLLGEGLNLLVMDEAAVIPREVWEESLRPALSDREGHALIMSRPKGASWFIEEFERGLKGDDPQYYSLHLRSIDNPWFPKHEWEAAKRQLPAPVFEQEYEAKVVSGAAPVFSHVDECLVEAVQPVQGKRFMGVDPGRTRDFTAIAILDQEANLIFAKNIRGLSFDLLIDEITKLAIQHNAEVWLDSHVIGRPLEDILRRSEISHLLRPFPVKDRNTRNALIENLYVGLDPSMTERHIKIPAGPGKHFGFSGAEPYLELYRELRGMDYKTTPSGDIVYLPGTGLHDDLVIALALAYWGLTRRFKPVSKQVGSMSVGLPSVPKTVMRRRSSTITRKWSRIRGR